MRFIILLLAIGFSLSNAMHLSIFREAVGAVQTQADDENALSESVALSVRADEVWDTLEKAGWVAERDPVVKPNGKVLYAVTFRSCPTCAAFKAAEYSALLRAGVEVRWILYARRDRDGRPRSKPGERAMVAALWKDRDPRDLERWFEADDLDAFYAGPHQPPMVETDPSRAALLAQSRALVERLTGLLSDNDLEMAIPALFWREGRTTHAYIGYSGDGFAPARAFLISQ